MPDPISPSPRIGRDDVAKVARLARLGLSDDELATATGQLAAIVEHFADIDELQLDDVEPMTQPYPLRNVFRDDVVQAVLSADEVLAAAPDVAERRFKVPPIIGLAE